MNNNIMKSKQPEPLPITPPMGKIIQFPIKSIKPKQPSMGCLKAVIMDWDFKRWLL